MHKDWFKIRSYISIGPVFVTSCLFVLFISFNSSTNYFDFLLMSGISNHWRNNTQFVVRCAVLHVPHLSNAQERWRKLCTWWTKGFAVFRCKKTAQSWILCLIHPCLSNCKYFWICVLLLLVGGQLPAVASLL